MAGTLTGGQNPRLALSVSNTQKQVMETATASGQTVLLGISGQSGVLTSTAAAATAVAEALTDSSYDGVYLNITRPLKMATPWLPSYRRSGPLSGEKAVCGGKRPGPQGSNSDYQALGKAADRIVLQVSGHEDTDGAVPVYAMEPLETVYYALSTLNDQIPVRSSPCFDGGGLRPEGYRKTTAFNGDAVAALEAKGRTYYSDRYACAIWRQRIRWSGISTKRRWKPASSCCAASAYPPAVSPPPTAPCQLRKAEFSVSDHNIKAALL